MILNTYRALGASALPSLHSLAIDLHTRLWRVEPRTYQFLHKILTQFKPEKAQPSPDDLWELNIVKANTIKAICEEK